MKTIFTSLSPNTERNDLQLTRKILFQPWRWRKGDATEELENDFKSYFSSKHAIATASGRTALYSILQALHLKEGDEVLLQAYTCVAVPEPIFWASGRPIYVDIDSDSLNMSPMDLEKKITKKSKVLIIQHTFGIPASIDELVAIARKHNLFVIEDCAHALGARYKNEKVGTFGDASFFSFGRDKVISSVFGGMVITKDSALAEKIRTIISAFPSPSIFWVKRQLLHPIVTQWVRALYDVYGLGRILFRLVKAVRLLPKAVYECERRAEKPSFIEKKLSNGTALLAREQFQKLDHLNAHRERVAKRYRRELAKCKTQEVPENTSPVFLRHTLLNKKSGELFKSAVKKKIYLGDWYRAAIAPSGVSYQAIDYYRTCPNAEKAAQISVNLPTDVHIDEEAANRIIETVKQFC